MALRGGWLCHVAQQLCAIHSVTSPVIARQLDEQHSKLHHGTVIAVVYQCVANKGMQTDPGLGTIFAAGSVL